MPNDIAFVGGESAGSRLPIRNEDDTTDDENDDELHSIVVCTGANACGKVMSHYDSQQT